MGRTAGMTLPLPVPSFWGCNMYSTADFSITPRPMYPADGRKFFDVYTAPFDIRFEIKKELGEFPFRNFWGPAAGIASSRWIAKSAKWIEERHRPDRTDVSAALGLQSAKAWPES